MNQDNTVILRVKLDEADSEKRMGQLTLDIEANRKAQQALNAERKAGQLTDEQFAKQSVELKNQLRGQQQEYGALTKNLELYRTAQNGQADSYKATQAALSLAIRQQQELAGSADNSSEASQALTKQIEQYRETLKATDAQQGAFFRNIGNYPKGENLESLVQQLVKLQEETKGLAAGTEEASRAQMRIIGFQTQAAQAGAKEGKSYEETTNFIKSYSAAIRPATAALVQLEHEQQAVVESGQATGEQVAQIGFKLGQARKSIEQATDALKETPAAAKNAGGAITSALGPAAEAAEVLGVDVGGLESGFTRAKKGVDIAKSAFGSLRGAMLAVPIFALLAALTALVAYFTKTREGAALLENTVAKVGAVFDVIIDRAGVLGKAVAQLFSGEFRAAAETARKSYQGIGDEIAREIDLAGRLSKQRQQLERDEISNIATNKTLLNQVERLKNVRDNEFNSIQKRKTANEEAYKVELDREKKLTDLAQRKVDLLKAEADRRGGLSKLGNDAYREYQDAVNAVQDIAEDAAGKQNELITNRYQLEQEAIDKSIERRAQAFAVEAAMFNKRLAQVQVNSDEELSIRQRLLNNERAAELNVKNLTVAQKKAIDLKYEQDSLTLSLDFAKRRLLAALQAQSDLTAAELAGQQAGSAQALQLQTQQIEEQRRLAIAALSANADNSAAIAKINAQAAQQRQAAEYADATRLLTEYLDNKRVILERDYAKGVIQEGEYQRRLAALNKAGTNAQAVINADYRQDNSANQKQATQNEIDEARRARDVIKQTEEAKQQIRGATVQAFDQAADAVIAAFGEESEAAELAKGVKKLAAIAEIEMSVDKQFAANAEAGAKISALAPPVTTPIGIAYTIAQDALAVAAAAAQVANILKLQDGGIALGPSHAQGGIPLYRNGRPAGIEIEGGEAVLTRRVTQNPLLLSLASTVNQLAGGRALVPHFPVPHLALGGVTQPLILEQLRGQAGQGIDYDRLAQALAKVNIEVKTSNIEKSMQQRVNTVKVSND